MLLLICDEGDSFEKEKGQFHQFFLLLPAPTPLPDSAGFFAMAGCSSTDDSALMAAIQSRDAAVKPLLRFVCWQRVLLPTRAHTALTSDLRVR